MDFFEKLGKKASETFNSAAEKTNKIASETKLKIKINDCKSKIKDLYQDIGKKVYQKFVFDGNVDIKEEISEELTRISELTDEIEAYEKQILESRNMKQCVNCHNKIEKNAKFCPECGTEQPEEVVQEAEVVQEEANAEENYDEEKAEQVAEDANNAVTEVVDEKEENDSEN